MPDSFVSIGAAGHKTIRLCRVAIGALELNGELCGDFEPGKWKYIDKDQIIKKETTD